MKRLLFILPLLALGAIVLTSGMRNKASVAVTGYAVGDKAEDFSLKNVDGKLVSLASFKDAKGFVVVFTCNHCPMAQKYEQRIIELGPKLKAKGFQLIAIQPNNPVENPEDAFPEMQKRAKAKGYSFPYLMDEGQKVYPKFGATRTPHVFVLDKNRVVSYIGAIDDNAGDPSAVKKHYVEMAADALLGGKKPDPSFTRAVGCGIN